MNMDTPVELEVARTLVAASDVDDAFARALAAIGTGLGLDAAALVAGGPELEQLASWERAPGAAAAAAPALTFPVRSERGELARVEGFAAAPVAKTPRLAASLELVGAQLGQLLERHGSERSGDAVRRRHRATLDASLDCVITMDHRGSVIEFNPAAERTFGFSGAEAVGREMADLIVPPELRERHRAGLRRYLEAGEGTLLDRRIEIEALRRDGSRFPVELTITRIEVPGEPVFTGHLRDITERVRVERELRESRVRLVEASDQARRQIERDLHDGSQQQLVSAAMTLEAAAATVERDPAAGRELIAEASAELRAAIAELRELARGIHPAVLAEGGLDPALRSLAARSGVPVELAGVPAGRFAAAAEAAAYFVVAEALTNVARHAAGASRVEIGVAEADGWLAVEVADDGPGGAVAEGGGLRGLADRVAALGGSFEVESPAGGGTRLKAAIPCG